MKELLNYLFALIPIVIIGLIIYVIIRVLKRKNKGEIDYGNSSLNILENKTAKNFEEDMD